MKEKEKKRKLKFVKKQSRFKDLKIPHNSFLPRFAFFSKILIDHKTCENRKMLDIISIHIVCMDERHIKIIKWRFILFKNPFMDVWLMFLNNGMKVTTQQHHKSYINNKKNMKIWIIRFIEDRLNDDENFYGFLILLLLLLP